MWKNNLKTRFLRKELCLLVFAVLLLTACSPAGGAEKGKESKTSSVAEKTADSSVTISSDPVQTEPEAGGDEKTNASISSSKESLITANQNSERKPAENEKSSTANGNNPKTADAKAEEATLSADNGKTTASQIAVPGNGKTERENSATSAAETPSVTVPKIKKHNTESQKSESSVSKVENQNTESSKNESSAHSSSSVVQTGEETYYRESLDGEYVDE